ncbi:MAG: lysophospholipid acyltransferase family protein [Planctomycetaceae bacterium]
MRIRSRWLTVAVGWLGSVLVKGLARTMRFEYLEDEPGFEPSGPIRPTIYVMWHDQIVPPLARHTLTRAKVAALVSRHQDGSYLAEFMLRSGIRPVRGSTSRGGDQALRELIDVPLDTSIFITPDGPRGPHHQLKSGAVFLASHSGRVIIPVATAVPRSWYLKGSWTGLLVPRLFSTCYFRMGSPFEVPPNLTREELQQHVTRLQTRLDELELDLQARLASGAPLQPVSVGPAANTLPAAPQGRSERRAA